MGSFIVTTDSGCDLPLSFDLRFHRNTKPG